MRDWKSVNNKYIKERELFLSFDFLHVFRREEILEKKNRFDFRRPEGEKTYVLRI